jgi:hypothetical protein
MRFLPYRPLPFLGVIAGQMGQMSRVGSLANPLVRGNFASVMGKIGSPKNKLPLPAPQASSAVVDFTPRVGYPSPIPCHRPPSLTAVSRHGVAEMPSYKRDRITHGNHPRSCRFPRTFQCLAVPRQPLKLLETLEIRVLKRLASAVQLRPWPP